MPEKPWGLGANQAGDQDDKQRDGHARKDLAKKRVLVVDDNIDTAMAMGEIMEIWGYETRLTYNGDDAVDLSMIFEPDVILLDIGLPGRNGFEVARTLRSQPRFAQTLIIAISGYGQKEDIRRSMEAGINHHFTKPVDLASLQSLLE